KKLEGLTEEDADWAIEFVQSRLERKLEFARLQDIPLNDDGSLGDVGDRRVRYDTEDEQKASLVTPVGGKLIRADGEAVDTSESSTFFSGKGTEIFVCSPDGDIHM